MSDFNLDEFCEIADLKDKLQCVVSTGSLEFVGTKSDCQMYINNISGGKYRRTYKLMTVWEYGNMKQEQGEYDGANAPNDPWDV